MSRSGYSDDIDNWELIKWRGAVASAMRGYRGQAFLNEMLRALEAMPEKKLVANELQEGENVCAMGAVGKARGIDMSKVDPDDREAVAKLFGIAPALAAEIAYLNDDDFRYTSETPEVRYSRMLAWVKREIEKLNQP